MTVACQNCGIQETVWRRHFARGDIKRCLRCSSFSFRFRVECPVDASSLYTEDYFIGGEYADYPGQRRVNEINARRLWRRFAHHVPKPIQLFEVGCAYGHFLSVALRSRARKVFGIDVCAAAIAAAQVAVGPYFGPPEARPDFDYNCLAAWAVWEHLERPFEFFSELVAGLPRGGIFVLTTVDSSSLLARLRGERWRQVSSVQSRRRKICTYH